MPKKKKPVSPRSTHRVLTMRVPLKESGLLEKLIAQETRATNRYFSANRLFLKLIREESARLRAK